MVSANFWGRYLARHATLTAMPGAFGPRDRLNYYDRAPLWRPEQGLSAFLAELVQDQQLQEAAPRIRAFLEFWMPRQALAVQGSGLVEFSFTTNKPGVGIMLYGDNRGMIRAYHDWCRIDGLDMDIANRCATLCETFDDAELSMVRAEFRPGDPTRISLSSSWLLDPLRWSGGFASRLGRLPPAQRNPTIEARIRTLEESLAPDFFPLFLGLSFDGGLLEPKLYFVRYANEPPLAPGSPAFALLAGLQLGEARLAEIRSAYQHLWAASADPMTQILVGVSGDEADLVRVNLITCGTRTGAVKDLLQSLGDPRFDARSVLPFERTMQTGRAKFVGLRITREGLSPRVKLYGQACFTLGS